MYCTSYCVYLYISFGRNSQLCYAMELMPGRLHATSEALKQIQPRFSKASVGSAGGKSMTCNLEGEHSEYPEKIRLKHLANDFWTFLLDFQHPTARWQLPHIWKRHCQSMRRPKDNSVERTEFTTFSWISWHRLGKKGTSWIFSHWAPVAAPLRPEQLFFGRVHEACVTSTGLACLDTFGYGQYGSVHLGMLCLNPINLEPSSCKLFTRVTTGTCSWKHSANDFAKGSLSNWRVSTIAPDDASKYKRVVDLWWVDQQSLHLVFSRIATIPHNPGPTVSSLVENKIKPSGDVKICQNESVHPFIQFKDDVTSQANRNPQ